LTKRPLLWGGKVQTRWSSAPSAQKPGPTREDCETKKETLHRRRGQKNALGKSPTNKRGVEGKTDEAGRTKTILEIGIGQGLGGLH